MASSRYKSIKKFTNLDNRRYYTNPIYPDIPLSEDDFYIITTDQDRYDILASQFYGDSSLWWIIPTANGTSNRSTLYPVPGTQLRIPANKDLILSLYQTLNNTR